MGNIWQLQEAKNRFSELVRQAHKNGPQIITKFGKKAVVILSIEDYKKLNKPKYDLVSFFKNSPLCGTDIDLARDKSSSRDIEL